MHCSTIDATFLLRLPRATPVPAIYGRREFARAGGLMSYGASTLDQYYQSGVYVGRILRGATTGEARTSPAQRRMGCRGS